MGYLQRTQNQCLAMKVVPVDRKEDTWLEMWVGEGPASGEHLKSVSVYVLCLRGHKGTNVVLEWSS